VLSLLVAVGLPTLPESVPVSLASKAATFNKFDHEE
jgi:hypothetical protein